MSNEKKFSNEAWSALLDRAVARIKDLAASKGAEYSGDEDRLDNFRRGGVRYGLPIEVIWGVYAGKHWDALQTYIRDLNRGVKRNYSEPIDGRVDDLLVYLLLFKAMLEESSEPKVILRVQEGTLGLEPETCRMCGNRIWTGYNHVCTPR